MINENSRLTLCAIFLLISVPNAVALTLEGFRGAVVLGRPLDFSVQAVAVANEELASLCLEADVFQAETLVNPARVNIQLIKSNIDDSSTIRVRSSSIVEEPVLTVVIKYGCFSKNSRRYVVFADPLSNSIPATQGINSAPTFAPSPSIRLIPAPVAPPTASQTSRIAASVRTRKTAATAPNALAQSRLLGSSTLPRNTRPRLQLDGIEPNSLPTAHLRSTLELPAAPSELSSVQRTEAAALWRVTGAQSEEISQDIQRLTALQVESLALREKLDTSGKEISRLSVQLRAAENDKYQNPLVYGLLATLALLLAGGFMRLGSKNNIIESAWWKSRRDKSKSGDVQNSEDPKKASFSNDIVQRPDPVVSLLTVSSISPAAERKDPEIFSDLLRFKSSDSAYTLLGASNNARGVNVEELFDIQQQADFFISLGQYDQAIEVLHDHIRDSVQTSPLVYLDLLKLYHRTSKRTEYKNLTAEFIKLFNVDVPVFDEFRDQTLALEAYQATLARIVFAWHTDGALKVIEDSVFREAGRSSEVLDLEAFRELLLLHSIAKDLLENIDVKDDEVDQASQPTILLRALAKSAASPSGIFQQTIPQKLPPIIDNSRIDVAYNENNFVAFQKPIGRFIGLDIDLTASSPKPSFYELTAVSEDAKKRSTVNR